jgi:hypothetical protein
VLIVCFALICFFSLLLAIGFWLLAALKLPEAKGQKPVAKLH